MFQLAYKGDIPIASIPACALYHKITIFDLILPRLMPAKNLTTKILHGSPTAVSASIAPPAAFQHALSVKSEVSRNRRLKNKTNKIKMQLLNI